MRLLQLGSQTLIQFFPTFPTSSIHQSHRQLFCAFEYDYKYTNMSAKFDIGQTTILWPNIKLKIGGENFSNGVYTI